MRDTTKRTLSGRQEQMLLKVAWLFPHCNTGHRAAPLSNNERVQLRQLKWGSIELFRFIGEQTAAETK
jgi:hypothetical protein